jgi:plastocyanin
MRRERSLTIAVAGGLFGLLLLAGPVGAITSAGVKIGETDERYHFSPTTTYVNVGGTVKWTNGTDAPHTVTSDTGSELDSPSLNEDKTFSHTFAATGTFAYHCTVHTYMTGQVVVLAAGVTAPPTDTAAPVAPVPGAPDPTPIVLLVVGAGGVLLGVRRFRRAN